MSVVLLHGFGESSTVWVDTAIGLSDICRIVVPDLPGCGKSVGLAQLVSLEDMADAIADLLDSIGITACHMIGHSMGGYITLAFADRYPDRLTGLVLYHSTAMPDSTSKKALRQRSIEFMDQYGAEPFLREAIPKLYAPAFREANPQLVEAHIQETLEWATPRLLGDLYRAMMERPDRRHCLQDSRRPSLCIAGALDKAVSLEESSLHGPLLQDGGLVVWDDVAHMGMQECPDRSLQCLREFLIRTQTN